MFGSWLFAFNSFLMASSFQLLGSRGDTAKTEISKIKSSSQDIPRGALSML